MDDCIDVLWNQFWMIVIAIIQSGMLSILTIKLLRRIPDEHSIRIKNTQGKN